MFVAKAYDWGMLSYADALERQRAWVAERQRGGREDALIVVEHPHVITLGRQPTSKDNVLSAGDVPVIEVERGGDATYHGPGQLVLYPILQLSPDEQDVHQLLRNLEEGIINTLGAYGIVAGRNTGKTGVWIGERKIASIGVACQKWVTFHGLALNVTTDLEYFHRIHPCGFDANIMTSIAAELGLPATRLDIGQAKRHLVQHVALALDRDVVEWVP